MSKLAVRERMNQLKRRFERRSAVFETGAAAPLAGAAVAFLEPRVPVTVMKMPTKLIGGIALVYLAPRMPAGAARTVAHELGHAALSVYGYLASKNRTLIAGDDSGTEL